jgi:anti-anti-sigma factor
MVSDLEIAALVDASGIRLTGELDFSTAPRFTEAVRAFPPGEELQLDLTALILVDSAGLHALLALARSRGERSLVFLNPSAPVMRSFEIAGIDQHPAIEIRHAGTPSVSQRAGSRPPRLRRTG